MREPTTDEPMAAEEGELLRRILAVPQFGHHIKGDPDEGEWHCTCGTESEWESAEEHIAKVVFRGAFPFLRQPADPPATALREDVHALLNGFHLTNGCMDAMNAALSRTFSIYADPEAGTDIDGDAVTVLDALRDFDPSYIVVSEPALRAALAAGAAHPTPAEEPPKAKRIDWSDVVVDEGDEAP